MPLTLNGNGQITGFTDTFAWAQTTDLPLTTLTGLTTVSTTWGINTYLEHTGATGRSAFNSVSAINPSAEIHIAECEIEIPSGWTGSGNHAKVGFNVGGANGSIMAGVRGDGQGYFERDQLANLGTVAYALPSVGSWLKIRTKWTVSSGLFQLYLNGVYNSSIVYQQAVSAGMTPGMSMDGTGTMRFRNLKSWSFTRYPSTPYPSDPA